MGLGARTVVGIKHAQPHPAVCGALLYLHLDEALFVLSNVPPALTKSKVLHWIAHSLPVTITIYITICQLPLL